MGEVVDIILATAPELPPVIFSPLTNVPVILETVICGAVASEDEFFDEDIIIGEESQMPTFEDWSADDIGAGGGGNAGGNNPNNITINLAGNQQQANPGKEALQKGGQAISRMGQSLGGPGFQYGRTLFG